MSYVWLIVAIVLVILKRLFNGAKCRIRADLKNKIVLITGGGRGIGKQTTQQLVRMGAHVIIASRGKAQAEQLIAALKARVQGAQVEFMELDLADTNSIRHFVQEFKSKFNRLDILINNAGVMMIPDRRVTKDNFEMQLGINHLGHFLLTNLLLDTIKQSAPSRIIVYSSKAHINMFGHKGTVNFDDIQSEKSYHPVKVYAQSKLCNILFTKELQRRLDEQKANVKCVCLHPGVVRTELGHEFFEKSSLLSKVITTLMYPLYFLFTKNAYYGSQTSVYLAVEQHEKLEGGAYYADCRVATSNPESHSAEKAKKLWALSEQLVKLN